VAGGNRGVDGGVVSVRNGRRKVQGHVLCPQSIGFWMEAERGITGAVSWRLWLSTESTAFGWPGTPGTQRWNRETRPTNDPAGNFWQPSPFSFHRNNGRFQ